MIVWSREAMSTFLRADIVRVVHMEVQEIWWPLAWLRCQKKKSEAEKAEAQSQWSQWSQWLFGGGAQGPIPTVDSEPVFFACSAGNPGRVRRRQRVERKKKRMHWCDKVLNSRTRRWTALTVRWLKLVDTDIDILILIFQRQVDRFQKSPGLQIRDVPRATGGAASTRTPTGGWLGSLAGMEVTWKGPPEMAPKKGTWRLMDYHPISPGYPFYVLRSTKTSKMVSSQYLNMITIGFWGTPMVPDNPKGTIGIFDAAVDHPAWRYQNDNGHGSNIKNINFL